MSAAARRAPRVANPKTNLQRATEALTDRPSLIATLHARYEAAWEEYNAIDRAQPDKPDDTNSPFWMAHWDARTAMQESADETDLIRRLILRQTPTSMEDLTILSFHVYAIVGQVDRKHDKEALDQGVKLLFSYLAGEGHVSFDLAGHQYAFGVAMADRRLRARRGLLEGVQ